ncbi:MAG: SDR family oxidoreductase [Bacteroidales bacterium]|nr:SDR family oxidoreductase [Bacteroidales bacterium]
MNNKIYNRYFFNKVIIITGSRIGLGKQLASRLAGYGAKVVINARQKEGLEMTKKELTGKGFTIHSVPGDVSKPEESKKIIEETINTFGKIDILINNAGISGKGTIEDTDPMVFENVINTNLLGSIYPTKYALPYLKQTNGSIIFISSVAGIRGLPLYSSYSASKMALTALAQSLKIELNNTKIHVGISYVSFTENDPQKLAYNSNGILEYLPQRTAVKVRPAEKTINDIIKQIKKRKSLSIHTILGKITWFFNKISPKLVEMVILRSIKKFE